jgi:8-oxo-dGTP diphosphatase
MPAADQGIDPGRYLLIPRTAVFVRRGDEYLLIKGAATKRAWAGKYNGLGGHVERGESALGSAQRELYEEAGLSADLWLCGTVIVDAGETGICLFVFCGENARGVQRPSEEGNLEWVRIEALNGLAVVEDLPALLGRIQRMKRGDAPFSARSYYDEAGRLKIEFVESVLHES